LSPPTPSPAVAWKKLAGAAPYLALLLFVLVFYRDILFTGNNFIPWDLPDYHLPQAVTMSKALRQGSLPLWDLSAFCGRPLYAQLGLQAFYPFRVITLLAVDPSAHLHVLRALEIELVLHVFLAAVFALWLARRLGLGGPAALISASGFALGCYFASQAEHIGAVEGAAWLPLAWLGVILLHERVTFGRFALLTGALTMMFLAGFTPSALPEFASVGLLSILCAGIQRTGWKPVVLTAAAAAAVCLVAAIQFFPTQELVRLGLGDLRANWRGTGGGISLAALGTLFNPNYLGSFSWKTFPPNYEITLVYLYNGWIMLALAVAGALIVRRRPVAILAILCGCSGLLMLGDQTPVGKAVFAALPRFIQGPLYPQHWMVVFSLSLALLAGYGMQRFAPPLKKWSYVVAILCAADLIVMSSSRPMNTTRFHPPSIGLDEAVDAEKEALAEVRRLAAASAPPARIDVYKNEATVWASAGALTGMPSANGTDALAVLRILKARTKLSDDVIWAFSPVKTVKPAILSAMSVRYLMGKEPIDPAAIDGTGLKVLKTFPGRVLYENSAALPRFYFVPRVTTTSGMERSVERIHRGEWDPSQEAVVEGADLPGGPFGVGEVEVLRYTPTSILLRTRNGSRGFLASSETHYPGWQATIDGRSGPIHHTNVAFRGIETPPGEHLVAFEFRPAILYRSAAVSLLSILLLCAWGVFRSRVVRP
jgi:hypothetical protein